MSACRAPRTAGHRTAGFTLVEVMIAVAIMSSMTVLIWGSYRQTFYSQRIVEANINRFRSARLALDRMVRDVQMAYLSNNIVPGTEQTPRTFFDGARRGDIDELRFSYFGHQRLYAESKEADASVVGYFGARDRDNPRSLNLYRKETRRLSPERFENMLGETELICDNVVRLQIDYYHPDRKEFVDKWQTMQADGYPNRLPSRVRFRLVVRDEAGTEVTFISEARIGMYQLLDTAPQS